MQSKADKEKLKLIQEKSQMILADLLRDDDNKYCVDCDAKGPRWASWNLGIFLCIRCAGIHRNLGVHISKVKSINLDSWSPEQIGHLQQMGNSKARAVYEANLPDNFRRPQGDSQLESFIRAKYEQKKYIAKEWIPCSDPPPAFNIEEELRKEREKKKNKGIKSVTNGLNMDLQTNPVPRPHSSPSDNIISGKKVAKEASKSTNSLEKSSDDLLGIEFSTNGSTTTNGQSEDDPFDAFVSAKPLTSNSNCDKAFASENIKQNDNKIDEEAEFFNQKAPEDKKLDKESILKLYESSKPVQHLNQFAPPLMNNQGFGAPCQQGIQAMPNNAFLGQNNGLIGATVAHQQQHQQQQSTQQPFFSVATNPFLSNPVPQPVAQVTQIQQQLMSVQLGQPVQVPTTNIWPTNQATFNNNISSVNPFLTPAPSIPTSVPNSNFFNGPMFTSTQTDIGRLFSASNGSSSNVTNSISASGTNFWQ